MALQATILTQETIKTFRIYFTHFFQSLVFASTNTEVFLTEWPVTSCLLSCCNCALGSLRIMCNETLGKSEIEMSQILFSIY